MAAQVKISRRNFLARRFGPRTKLFISYRRRFDYGSARLLKEQLTEAFGEGTVFRDVDSIPPGEDFPESIRKAIESSDAFLPLISPGWVGVIGELQDARDFVRREIAFALARPVPLIPVLLGGAEMPEPEDLPEEIRSLASRQAVELSESRWDYDVQRLIEAVRSRATRPAPASFLGRAGAAFARLFATWPRRLAAAALLAAAVYVYYPRRAAPPPPPSPMTYEQCLSLFRALGPHEATAAASVVDTPVVGFDRYRPAGAAAGAGGFPLLIRLTESGRDIGAVSLVYDRGDEYPKGGIVFRVVTAFEPPCARVTDYFNHDGKAQSEVYNWDTLTLRLSGRPSRLRLGDHGDSLLATLTRGPE